MKRSNDWNAWVRGSTECKHLLEVRYGLGAETLAPIQDCLIVIASPATTKKRWLISNHRFSLLGLGKCHGTLDPLRYNTRLPLVVYIMDAIPNWAFTVLILVLNWLHTLLVHWCKQISEYKGALGWLGETNLSTCSSLPYDCPNSSWKYFAPQNGADRWEGT